MPRVKVVIAEIGTTGRFERFTLESAASDIARAVDLEHHCDDDACDIAAAMQADCPYSAAYLLQGATETPLLDAVLRAYGVNLHYFEHVPDWDEWVAYHHAHGVKCQSCGSFTYGDDYYTPERCGNCFAPLPTEEDEDEC